MGGLEVTVSNRKVQILHYNICMCVCGTEGGRWGRREGGEEPREKHLFSKCVSSVVMGIKCLFALCMTSES